VLCSSVAEAINAFDSETFDWIFIDRDLGKPADGFGEDFAKHVVQTAFGGRVVVHSANLVAAVYIEKLLSDARVKVERIPFTILGCFTEK
jgi:hypothetical protein